MFPSSFTLFLWLSLLIVRGFSCCASSDWQLLTQDNVSDSLEITSISFENSNHGWALTSTQLLETNDGGHTWTIRLDYDGEKTFHALEFVSPTTGFITGAQRNSQGRSTMILRTEDSGRSWHESHFKVSSPVVKGPLRLHDISFCNSEVGWAVGSNLIVHTTDGGHTWETQHTGDNEESLFSVACINPESAIVVGGNGIILQTKDGGNTWSRQVSEMKDNLARVRFFGDRGWIVGGLAGKSILLRTLDGGAKWELVPLNTSEPLFDIYLNGSQGWIVGAKGIILHTDNGGQIWKQEVSPTNNDLTSVFFLTPQQGWIGGDKHTVLRLAN